MARLRLRALALAFAIALLAAGCGGGDDSTSESASATGGRSYGAGSSEAGGAPAAEASGPATVSVGSVAELGRVLVDSEGFTVYDFHQDRGGESACYGACAEAWPPLLSDGAPQSSNGAAASMLGTTKRRDGTTQVTYAGGVRKRLVYFHDPEGNLLELCEYKAP